MKIKNEKEVMKLIKKAIKIQLQLESVKPLYVEMDRITEQLVNANMMESTIGKYRIYIADNFREKNTAWKSSAFRRYQIKLENKPIRLDPFTIKRR